MEIPASSPFTTAFEYCSGKTGERFQNPLYYLTELLTGFRFRESLSEVRQFGEAIVAKADERQRQSHLKTSADSGKEVSYGRLLDAFLDILGERKLVQDAALNFLSAGRDTTAQALTWTFYFLTRHPSYSSVILSEIFPVIFASTSTTLEIPSLSPTKLPFTTAIIYESLRLRPPIPFEIKQVASPTALPDGTFLPTNSIVFWSIWALNRDPSAWGPYDSDSFVPERWLQPSSHRDRKDDGSVEFKSSWKSAYEFPVFNAGPRACLGRRLAELMMVYVVVRVVAEFEIEGVRDGKEDPKTGERRTRNSLTLPMEGGLPVMVKVRK
ncbi:MAG: hypothetical protein Q9227_006272 [Pyrenula ochraceoflavens]